VTEERPPGGEHDDPLLRAVAEYWDDIRRLADPRQAERLAGLLAGTAEADPGVARAALTDTLLDVLPPDHPVIGVLRSAPMYDSGRKTGPVVLTLGGDHVAGAIVLAAEAGHVPVTIYLTDEHHHAQVEFAVETVLATLGVQIIDRDDPVIGSWFRRMTGRAKDGLRSPASQDAALTVAHVLDSRLILPQDAEVTAKLLENLGPVIAALETVSGAVIRAGALLVVKQAGEISVLQLTAAQQARLDHHPQLVRSPDQIMAALVLVPEHRSSEDAAGAALDLYVEEPVLGQDSRFLRETSVSFGRPRVVEVPDDELKREDGRRPDLQGKRVVEILLPFDLEEPPDGCRYTETTVRMTFDTPEVLALKLSRPPAETGGDRADDSMLDTRGQGRRQLTWKLSALDEQSGLRPSGREVLAVVTAPIAAQRLTGALDVSIRFTRRVFGVVQRSTAEPRHPLRFMLDVVDGTFETFTAEDTPG
jgi:hypothetical protein